MIARGDIYWVDHGGGRGAELRKTRPAVVMSIDAHNVHLETVLVAPLSSGPAKSYEVDVPVGLIGDGRACRIKTHQIRAVDKSRLGRKFGRLPSKVMESLEKSLAHYLGLDSPPLL